MVVRAQPWLGAWTQSPVPCPPRDHLLPAFPLGLASDTPPLSCTLSPPCCWPGPCLMPACPPLPVENENHCDFVKLREMLIRVNMEDLREQTHSRHYELYRRCKLEEMGFQDSDGDSQPFR